MENGKIKVWLPAIQAGSGADVYTRRLAVALERRGITACISWFPLSHELLPFLLKHARPPAGTDIVIANSWIGYAFRRSNLPLIVVVHHCIFNSELRSYKSALQSFYHRYIVEPREVLSLHEADAVVAVSNYVAEQLRHRLGVDKVKVIYNWIETDLFRPLPVEPRRDRPFRLLFVGRPKRLKGIDMLAPLMRRLGEEFELHLTADPQECKKMNLPANVIPIGRLAEQELIRAYQECDALLLPSRAEGFGFTALEAMACGKPVIASNNTALPEIVADGVTGILCNTDDISAFENACRLLASDPYSCAAMGSKGSQRAVEKFSEARSVENYIFLMNRFL